MIVVMRETRLSRLSDKATRYATPSQLFVTDGHKYEIHAVAVFDGVVLLMLLSDIRQPAWLPAGLFDLVDPTLPSDWICSVFADEPTLILGPAFIARTQEAYASMVQLEQVALGRFWQRVVDLERIQEAASTTPPDG